MKEFRKKFQKLQEKTEDPEKRELRDENRKLKKEREAADHRWETEVAGLRRLPKKDFKLLSEDRFDDVFGPSKPEFNEYWTPADEYAFVENWDSTFIGAAIHNASKAQCAYMLPLWKLCVRLYECTPFAIVSPAKGLEYKSCGTDPVTIDGMTGPNRFWSGSFCRALSQILTHRRWWAWEDNRRRLAFADLISTLLQFAVIHASDDRRGWAMVVLTESPLLVKINEAVRTGPLDESVHEIHKRIRLDHGPGEESAFSDLLYTFGEMFPLGTKPANPGVTPLNRPKYWIDAEDVRRVCAALDECRSGTSTCEGYHEMYMSARGSHGPPSGTQLTALMVRSMRDLERRMLKALGTPERLADNASDRLGDEDEAWDAGLVDSHSPTPPQEPGEEDGSSDEGLEESSEDDVFLHFRKAQKSLRALKRVRPSGLGSAVLSSDEEAPLGEGSGSDDERVLEENPVSKD